MAETNLKPLARDIQGEEPISFLKPEEVERVRNGMNLRIPIMLEYMNTLLMCRLSNLDKHDLTCTICREPYETDGYTPGSLHHGDRQREIPLRLTCGHIFGNACITHWLNQYSYCPYCNCTLFEKMPGIDTEAGTEWRLGFLELCAMHNQLEPQDERVRDWMWERLAKFRARRAHRVNQEQRELEFYGAPETEREETRGNDGGPEITEDAGWYRYHHERIYSPGPDDTGETPEEDAQTQEEPEDSLD